MPAAPECMVAFPTLISARSRTDRCMFLSGRTRSRSSALSLAVIGGLVGSLFAAGPAFALTGAQVPANPADWVAKPYSPLQWPDDDAEGNALYLDFTGEAGGLPDKADVGTGFTMVQPKIVAGTTSSYQAGNLSVANGRLSVATTAGIANTTTNTQDNALGVGVNAAGRKLYFTTTLSKFPSTVNNTSAQGGIWFGPDDKNYVKLVVTSASGGRQVQLAREVGDANPNTQQINSAVLTTAQTS